MRIGMGYDFLNGEFKADCLKGNESPITPYPAVISDWTWEESVTTSDMQKSLAVSVSAAYKALPTNVSGKASFLSNVNISEYSSSFVGRQTLVKAEQVYLNDRYEDSIGDLAKSDPITFRQRCGTHFIRAISHGGEYNTVLSHTTRSQDERKEFAAALNASVNAYKGDASASNTFQSSRFFGTTKVLAYKAGGSALSPLDPSAVRSDFQQIRSDVDSGKWVPVSATLQRYPDALPQLHPKMAALDQAYSILVTYKDVQSTLDSLEQHPELYFVDPATIDSVMPTVRASLDKIRTQLISKMTTCSQGSGDEVQSKCDFSTMPRPSAPGPSYGLPVLYKEMCPATLESAPYSGGHFQNMPHKSSDTSMGGRDVIQIATCYSFRVGGNVEQSINVRGVETSFNSSLFENNPMTRVVWQQDQHGGCVVSKTFLDGVCRADGVADISSGPIQFTPAGSHDYTDLSFNEKLVAGAVCRTNKQNDDLNWVGCKEIRFLPIPSTLEHIEVQGGSPKPAMIVPGWLR